jgi:hypothetical protein
VSARAIRNVSLTLVVVALVALLLASQALATYSAPSGSVQSTGSLLGHTGFEYLGGLRRFVAAVLWNRLEPQFHQFGSGKIQERPEFLTTMRVVQLLDPQFEQSYYVAAYVLAEIGRTDEAITVARDGLENNPKSGLMRSNLIQILMRQDRQQNLPEMVKLAREGSAPDMTWANDDDKFEGYGVFATILKLGGDEAASQRLKAAQAELRRQSDAQGGGELH